MTRFEDPLRVKYGQLDVTDHPYIFAADVDFGAGENLYEALAGLLADGESVTSPRTSNREFSFGVWVEGPTLDQIEDPEMALIAEAERPRNELTVWPGDNGTPFVLETFRAQVEHERTDARERAGMRLIVLTVKALPFVRAVNRTITEAMSAPPDPVSPPVHTLVDACDSASGWSAVGSSMVASGGFVYNSTRVYAPDLTRTGNVSLSSAGTPYLVVEWSRELANLSKVWQPPHLIVNGGAQRSAVQTAILDRTWARSVYNLSDVASASSLRFRASGGMFALQRLHIRDIQRVDRLAPPASTTGHQLSRTIEIGGSARTQASLHMWHDSNSLGDVLVHTSTSPNGMFSCEPFRTSNATTTAGMVSGTEKNLEAGVAYDIPASMFNPTSPGRLLLARARRPGVGPLNVTIRPMRDTPSGPVDVGTVELHSVTPPPMPTMGFVALGVFNMPPHRLDGADAIMRVVVSGEGVSALDDLWFVDVETGSLTWVNGLAGLLHLWIESPTIDEPLPRVRAAINADGRGGFETEPMSMGRHDFPPGPLHIHTVATSAKSSKVQAEYYERGLLHLRR